MTAANLQYIADNAARHEHGSIQRVSCADIRKLLAEREGLLNALQRIEGMCNARYESTCGIVQEAAREAIQKVTT